MRSLVRDQDGPPGNPIVDASSSRSVCSGGYAPGWSPADARVDPRSTRPREIDVPSVAGTRCAPAMADSVRTIRRVSGMRFTHGPMGRNPARSDVAVDHRALPPGMMVPRLRLRPMSMRCTSRLHPRAAYGGCASRLLELVTSKKAGRTSVRDRTEQTSEDARSFSEVYHYRVKRQSARTRNPFFALRSYPRSLRLVSAASSVHRRTNNPIRLGRAALYLPAPIPITKVSGFLNGRIYAIPRMALQITKSGELAPGLSSSSTSADTS
jgi:hypothetical protein